MGVTTIVGLAVAAAGGGAGITIGHAAQPTGSTGLGAGAAGLGVTTIGGLAASVAIGGAGAGLGAGAGVTMVGLAASAGFGFPAAAEVAAVTVGLAASAAIVGDGAVASKGLLMLDRFNTLRGGAGGESICLLSASHSCHWTNSSSKSPSPKGGNSPTLPTPKT